MSTDPSEPSTLNMIYDEQVRQGKKIDGLHDGMGEVKSEVAGLKVKSGIWGGLSGIFAAVAAVLGDSFFRR